MGARLHRFTELAGDIDLNEYNQALQELKAIGEELLALPFHGVSRRRFEGYSNGEAKFFGMSNKSKMQEL
jgi:hypothetical protein